MVIHVCNHGEACVSPWWCMCVTMVMHVCHHGIVRNSSWPLAIFQPISIFGRPKSILLGQIYCIFLMIWQSMTKNVWSSKNSKPISDLYFYHCHGDAYYIRMRWTYTYVDIHIHTHTHTSNFLFYVRTYVASSCKILMHVNLSYECCMYVSMAIQYFPICIICSCYKDILGPTNWLLSASCISCCYTLNIQLA